MTVDRAEPDIRLIWLFLHRGGGWIDVATSTLSAVIWLCVSRILLLDTLELRLSGGC